MRSPNTNPVGDDTYEQALSSNRAAVCSLADGIRALIANVMPGVTEVAWPNQGIIGYGVGPKKMSEQFCYIGLYDQHVNLGFYYGADLADPDGLLVGSGKMMRHIRVESAEDLEHAGVRRLIENASRHLPKLKMRGAS